MSSAFVAEQILAQLGGGNRFKVMTGASSFSSGIMRDGQPGLSFRLPRCKQGIRSCIITLSPEDLYDVTFAKMKDLEFTVVQESKGVGVENLRSVFEEATGLLVSL